MNDVAVQVNPREMKQDELPVPLPSYIGDEGIPRHGGVWPGFGWEGHCCDVAIGADSVAAIRFCHDHGFINHNTRDLYNFTLRALARKRGSVAVERLLMGLGYPE